MLFTYYYCFFSLILCSFFFFFFFFNDTATTEIYTLSLHDALPICKLPQPRSNYMARSKQPIPSGFHTVTPYLTVRSEEHTSELQSQSNLVCRLLLEKKKKTRRSNNSGLN